MIDARILKGFRDALPVLEVSRQNMIGKIRKVFESFGFVPIDTPALEYSEVLLQKGGGETDKQTYRFQDNGKRDVSLRFDLTIPFSRFMAMRKDDLYLPFRRYQIAKVWRGENAQKGRYREFTQCDCDIVGATGTSSDLEILLVFQKVLEAVSSQKFSMKISHRQLFLRFLDGSRLLSRYNEIARIVDKRGKISELQMIAELNEIAGEKVSAKIVDFITPKENFVATLGHVTKLLEGENEMSMELSSLYNALQENGASECVVLDPSVIRGLDYYTGLVFETTLNAMPGLGSVCSGGRYDNLVGLYSPQKMPGIGGSLGLDRLLSALEELEPELFQEKYCDAIIFNEAKIDFGKMYSLAQNLRDKGLRIEVFPEVKKLAMQYKQAEIKKIPFGIFCEPEMGTKGATLKKLETREIFEKIEVDKIVQLVQNAT